MTYEDVARVAQLKTKPERFAKIRAEAEMKPDQILTVTEYLKPRADEIAADPAGEDRRGLPAARRAKRARRVSSARASMSRRRACAGFLTMRALAQFRRIRRSSLRFGQEQRGIERWLEAMTAALAKSPAFAAALAELPRLLKGYGETQARGQRNYDAIFETLVKPALAAGDFSGARKLRSAISAALAAPERAALDAELRQAAE